MRQKVFRKSLLVLSSLFIMSAPYAGTPVWTFTPLTPTTITLTQGGTAVVQYQVTNQSSVTHVLAMNPIGGVQQITAGAGICSNPFTLSEQESCVLSLRVIGSQVASGNTHGPVVCETDGSLQCYRPAAANILTVNASTGGPFTIGGTIAGLTSSVELNNIGIDTETFSSDGAFTFSTPLQQGQPYDVTVTTQPTNQTCTIANGAGTVGNANVTDIAVNCATTSFSVGGSVGGLTGTVSLQNNGTDTQAISTNGSFTFPTTIANGQPYNVTVSTQPASQFCNVSNPSGIINNANVTNVTVTCATNSYTVGGTVSGLAGTVTLLNNGGNSTPITTNGPFTFSTPVADGSAYNVTVGVQPVGQTCLITNGSGTMGGSNVTNVSVACTTDNTTLTTSPSNLVLQTSGLARVITITNTGTVTAQNLSISNPTYPSGTSSLTTCGSSLLAAASCTITVTPGANATSGCASGTAAVPGVVTVGASNVTGSVTTNVAVLDYQCIYQQGYVFSIDDTTPSTVSAGGSTIALSDISASNVWANNITTITGASSLTNGPSNTAVIVGSSVATGSAAQLCTNYTIDSAGNSPCSTGTCYNNWYLPAICQLGPSGLDAGCPTGIQNIATTLSAFIGCGTPNCLPFAGWSSTESNVAPAVQAWQQQFTGAVVQTSEVKQNTIPVRCTRDFS